MVTVAASRYLVWILEGGEANPSELDRIPESKKNKKIIK